MVEYFFRQPDFKELIEEQLHLVGDLERIICFKMLQKFFAGSSFRKHPVVQFESEEFTTEIAKRWIVFPLKDEKPINERLNVVEYFFRQPDFPGNPVTNRNTKIQPLTNTVQTCIIRFKTSLFDRFLLYRGS